MKQKCLTQKNLVSMYLLINLINALYHLLQIITKIIIFVPCTTVVYKRITRKARQRCFNGTLNKTWLNRKIDI